MYGEVTKRDPKYQILIPVCAAYSEEIQNGLITPPYFYIYLRYWQS